MLLKEYIDQEIGLGKYQITTFLILSFVGINDGVEIILSSFLNPILKRADSNFNSSNPFFSGMILGSLSSGYLSDKYGRRSMIINGAILQILSGTIFYLSTSLLLMFFIRFIYGFAFGFSICSMSPMFIQICPTKYRGKFLLMLNFSISLGKMSGLLLGYLFMKDDLSQTDWKTMMCCGSLPSLVVFLGCVLAIQQSPRFLLVNNKFQQAFQVLHKIAYKNHGSEAVFLRQNDKKSIKEQFQGVNEHQNMSYMAIIHQKYLKKSIGLLLVWFINNFCYYGQLTVQALHISISSTRIDFHDYFLTIIGELPTVLVGLFLVDQVSFGRKTSLIIFDLLGSMFHFFYSLKKWIIFGTFSRFFMKSVYLIAEPLTTQSYETKIRMKGYSFCQGLGKIGSVIMPYIVIPMDDWKQASVYILLSSLMVVGGLTAYSLLEQTMNKNLDEIKLIEQQ